jgi:hypothetical protein
MELSYERLWSEGESLFGWFVKPYRLYLQGIWTWFRRIKVGQLVILHGIRIWKATTGASTSKKTQQSLQDQILCRVFRVSYIMARDNRGIFKVVSCARAISLYRRSEGEHRKADTKKKSSPSIQFSTQTDMKLSTTTSTPIVFAFFLHFPSSPVNQISCSLYHIFFALHHIRWFHIAVSIFSKDPRSTDFFPTHQLLSLSHTHTYAHTHIHTDPQILILFPPTLVRHVRFL